MLTMSEGLKKHTLWLRKGDWDYLASMFRPQGISTSLAVRSIISNFVDAKRAEENADLPEIDVRIDL